MSSNTNKKLADIAKIFFINRNEYTSITSEEKKINFFILNRYMYKILPDLCLELSSMKNIDYTILMDILFLRSDGKLNKYNYQTFWKGKDSVKKKKSKDLIEKILSVHEEAKENDLSFIEKYLK